MKKKFFLVGALLIFVLALTYYTLAYVKYQNTINYFGNAMYGRGYWLHPQNVNYEKLERRKSYEGRVLEVFDSSNEAYWGVTLEMPSGDTVVNQTLDLPRKFQKNGTISILEEGKPSTTLPISFNNILNSIVLKQYVVINVVETQGSEYIKNITLLKS